VLLFEAIVVLRSWLGILLESLFYPIVLVIFLIYWDI